MKVVLKMIWVLDSTNLADCRIKPKGSLTNDMQIMPVSKSIPIDFKDAIPQPPLQFKG